MQRASNEWKQSKNGAWDWVANKGNVVEFMREGVRRAGGNDTYFTLGMRGENDGPIQADDPIAVLREVFAVQRNILASFYGNETAARRMPSFQISLGKVRTDIGASQKSGLSTRRLQLITQLVLSHLKTSH